MKPEIRALRKCQKFMRDMQWPGYPFQMTIVIDLKEKKAWVDYGKEQTLDQALLEISQPLLYQAVGCTLMTKRTFLQDQELSTAEKIIKADYDDLYIDNEHAVKFYLALMSTIYNHKREEQEDTYIFGCVDRDTDYVEVKEFKNLDEIKKFYEDYFSYPEEED